MLVQREHSFYPTFILACYSSNAETSQLQNILGFTDLIDSNAAWSLAIALILKSFPSRVSESQKDEISNSFLTKAIDYQNHIQLPLGFDIAYVKTFLDGNTAREEARHDTELIKNINALKPYSWSTNPYDLLNVTGGNVKWVGENLACNTLDDAPCIAATIMGVGFKTDTIELNDYNLVGLYIVATGIQGTIYNGLPVIDPGTDAREYIDSVCEHTDNIKEQSTQWLNDLVTLVAIILLIAIVIVAVAVIIYFLWWLVGILGPVIASAFFALISVTSYGPIFAGETSDSMISHYSDDDGDTLMTSVENLMGTSPTNPDTDNDGLWDNHEYTYNNYYTDPLNPNTDGDYLYDGAEVYLGFNPDNSNDPSIPSEIWDNYSFLDSHFSGVAWQNYANLVEVYIHATPDPQYNNGIGGFPAIDGQFTIDFDYSSNVNFYVTVRYYGGETFEIPFYETTIMIEPVHTVTFLEAGLDSGISWSVIFNGQTYYSTFSSIIISSVQASSSPYSYSVNSISGYSISPTSGTVTVNDMDAYVTVMFTRIYYTLTFTESYKPSGSTWSMYINGVYYSISGTSKSITLPVNSAYSYSVNTLRGVYMGRIVTFYPTPSSGSGVLTSDYTINIVFSPYF